MTDSISQSVTVAEELQQRDPNTPAVAIKVYKRTVDLHEQQSYGGSYESTERSRNGDTSLCFRNGLKPRLETQMCEEFNSMPFGVTAQWMKLIPPHPPRWGSNKEGVCNNWNQTKCEAAEQEEGLLWRKRRTGQDAINNRCMFKDLSIHLKWQHSIKPTKPPRKH